MPASFNFYLRKEKQLQDGNIPIYIRITIDRVYKFKSTGIKIEEKYWNPKSREVRKNHPLHNTYNQTLNSLSDKLQKFISKAEIENKKITFDSIIKHLNSKIEIQEGIPIYVEEYTLNYAKKVKENYYYRYKKVNNLYNKLISFSKKKHIKFETLDKAWLSKFAEYLKRVDNNNSITIKRMLSTFKMVITDAIDNKVIKPEQDPFIHFKFSASQQSSKEKLSPEQIDAIVQLQIETDSAIWHNRNEFLFSFYCAGIRFGDLCTLKWSNIIDGYLVYVMSKTEHKKPIPRKIKLVKQALEILEWYRHPETAPNTYIFPEIKKTATNDRELKAQISSRNALANKNLKKIAKLAGIEANISFHVSRHSYADFARSKGISLYSISKALGHSKLETTQVYLKDLDQQYVDTEHESLFE